MARKDTKTPLSPREKISNLSAYNSLTKRWLWIGVISVSLIIFGLWGYAMATQLSFFQLNDTNEAHLFTRTREEWNAIFENQQPVTGDVKKQISEAMEHLVASSTAPIATSTSPATTTPLKPLTP